MNLSNIMTLNMKYVHSQWLTDIYWYLKSTDIHWYISGSHWYFHPSTGCIPQDYVLWLIVILCENFLCSVKNTYCGLSVSFTDDTKGFLGPSTLCTTTDGFPLPSDSPVLRQYYPSFRTSPCPRVSVRHRMSEYQDTVNLVVPSFRILFLFHFCEVL